MNRPQRLVWPRRKEKRLLHIYIQSEKPHMSARNIDKHDAIEIACYFTWVEPVTWGCENDASLRAWQRDGFAMKQLGASSSLKSKSKGKFHEDYTKSSENHARSFLTKRSQSKSLGWSGIAAFEVFSSDVFCGCRCFRTSFESAGKYLCPRRQKSRSSPSIIRSPRFSLRISGWASLPHYATKFGSQAAPVTKGSLSLNIA